MHEHPADVLRAVDQRLTVAGFIEVGDDQAPEIGPRSAVGRVIKRGDIEGKPAADHLAEEQAVRSSDHNPWDPTTGLLTHRCERMVSVFAASSKKRQSARIEYWRRPGILRR